MTENTYLEHSAVPDTKEDASGAVATAPLTLEATLYPRRTPFRVGRRHVYAYDVHFDGEPVVVGSHDPEFALARALLARGIVGKITLIDGTTGKPRTIVDIEGAAKRCTVEPNDRRARFAVYRQGAGDD